MVLRGSLKTRIECTLNDTSHPDDNIGMVSTILPLLLLLQQQQQCYIDLRIASTARCARERASERMKVVEVVEVYEVIRTAACSRAHSRQPLTRSAPGPPCYLPTTDCTAVHHVWTSGSRRRSRGLQEESAQEQDHDRRQAQASAAAGGARDRASDQEPAAYVLATLARS